MPKFTFHVIYLNPGIYFSDWIRKLDVQCEEVILLLDNASCHKVPQELANITIHFLPQRSLASALCIAGIIRWRKAKYKRIFIQKRVGAMTMLWITKIEAFTLKRCMTQKLLAKKRNYESISVIPQRWMKIQ
jgi:hypothetical protein